MLPGCMLILRRQMFSRWDLLFVHAAALNRKTNNRSVVDRSLHRSPAKALSDNGIGNGGLDFSQRADAQAHTRRKPSAACFPPDSNGPEHHKGKRNQDVRQWTNLVGLRSILCTWVSTQSWTSVGARNGRVTTNLIGSDVPAEACTCKGSVVVYGNWKLGEREDEYA